MPLALLAAACGYPVIWIVFTALKDPASYDANPIGPPTNPTWSAISDLLTGGYAVFILHSGLVLLITLPTVLLLSAMMAFALAHLRFRLRGLTLAFVVFLMIQPPVLILIPLFFLLLKLQLLSTFQGLVLAYIATFSPFSVYMLYSFFLKIPKDLLDAAAVDGATPVRTFIWIALPLARSSLVALATLLFIAVWNEPLLSVTLTQSDDTRTVAGALLRIPSEFRIPVTSVAAGMFISIIPPLVAFLLLQRVLVRSLFAGAVK